jgi:hypothetical protein
MPFEIRWSERSVYRRFWGRLQADEYTTAQDAVYGDSRFDDLRHSIIDFTDVTEFVVTGEQAELMAAVTRGAFRSNPYVRGAFVTRVAWVVELLNSTFADSPYPLAVCASLEEAQAWVHAR